MYRKIFLCLFGACLLLQLASGNAVSKEESSEKTKHQPLEELLIYAVSEFATVSKYIIDNGKVIMENVLKDMEKMETKTDALQANITRITDYFAKLKKFDEKNSNKKLELFEMASELGEILDVIDEEKEPDNVEIQALSKSYTEHGGDKFDKDVEDRLTVFMNKFSERFEEYAKLLTKDEEARDKKFFDWYANLKAEKDTDKQLEIFFKFFEMAIVELD